MCVLLTIYWSEIEYSVQSYCAISSIKNRSLTLIPFWQLWPDSGVPSLVEIWKYSLTVIWQISGLYGLWFCVLQPSFGKSIFDIMTKTFAELTSNCENLLDYRIAMTNLQSIDDVMSFLKWCIPRHDGFWWIGRRVHSWKYPFLCTVKNSDKIINLFIFGTFLTAFLTISVIPITCPGFLKAAIPA